MERNLRHQDDSFQSRYPDYLGKQKMKRTLVVLASLILVLASCAQGPAPQAAAGIGSPPGTAVPSKDRGEPTPVDSYDSSQGGEGQGNWPWVGITIATVTPALAADRGLQAHEGVIVLEVFLGSPAERAGLRRGDVIIGLAGADTPEFGAFRQELMRHRPGEIVELAVQRGNRALTVVVTLAGIRSPLGQLEPILPRIPLEIVSVTPPADPGKYTVLEARTVPGAYCTISVLHDGAPVEAAELNAKKANAEGRVIWMWKVNTTEGSWSIFVTAEHDGGQARVGIEFMTALRQFPPDASTNRVK